MCAVFSNWTTWPLQASTRRNTAGCSNYNSSAPHGDVQLRSWNDGSVFLGIKQWLQYFEINQNWALSGGNIKIGIFQKNVFQKSLSQKSFRYIRSGAGRC